MKRANNSKVNRIGIKGRIKLLKKKPISFDIFLISTFDNPRNQIVYSMGKKGAKNMHRRRVGGIIPSSRHSGMINMHRGSKNHRSMVRIYVRQMVIKIRNKTRNQRYIHKE